MYCSNIVRSLCDLRKKSSPWSGIKKYTLGLKSESTHQHCLVKTGQTLFTCDGPHTLERWQNKFEFINV